MVFTISLIYFDILFMKFIETFIIVGIFNKSYCVFNQDLL